MESSWGVSRVFFEIVTLGSVVVMVLMGIVFWWLGRGAIAKGLVDDKDLLAIPAGAGASGDESKLSVTTGGATPTGLEV
jgi:hypothetical protein